MPAERTQGPTGGDWIGCPRCDYDLRGDVATWASSCPLEGRCPECGLGFPWRTVLVEGEGVPAWCVERAGVPLRRTAPRSLARSFRPGRFWGKLPLTLRGSLWRAAVYAGGSGAAVVVLAGLVELVIEFSIGTGSWRLTPASFYSDPLSPLLFSFNLLTAPFGMFSALPAWGTRPHFNLELFLVVVFSAAVPLVYLALPMTLRRCRVRRVHVARAFLYGVPWALAWAEGLYLTHLVFYYARWSWPWLLPGRVTSFAMRASEAGVFWMIGLVLCQWVWWDAVNRRYLRLPRPRAVTAVTLVVASLVALAPLFAFTWTGELLVLWLGL